MGPIRLPINIKVVRLFPPGEGTSLEMGNVGGLRMRARCRWTGAMSGSKCYESMAFTFMMLSMKEHMYYSNHSAFFEMLSSIKPSCKSHYRNLLAVLIFCQAVSPALNCEVQKAMESFGKNVSIFRNLISYLNDVTIFANCENRYAI